MSEGHRGCHMVGMQEMEALRMLLVLYPGPLPGWHTHSLTVVLLSNSSQLSPPPAHVLCMRRVLHHRINAQKQPITNVWLRWMFKDKSPFPEEGNWKLDFPQGLLLAQLYVLLPSCPYTTFWKALPPKKKHVNWTATASSAPRNPTYDN